MLKRKILVTIIIVSCILMNYQLIISTANTNNIKSAALTETEIEIKSSEKPTRLWNIQNLGKYTFSCGSNNNTYWYSDYKLFGKTTYQIFINNKGKNDLTIMCENGSNVYLLRTIQSKTSEYLTLTNMSASTQFYIKCRGSNMTGYIK